MVGTRHGRASASNETKLNGIEQEIMPFLDCSPRIGVSLEAVSVSLDLRKGGLHSARQALDGLASMRDQQMAAALQLYHLRRFAMGGAGQDVHSHSTLPVGGPDGDLLDGLAREPEQARCDERILQFALLGARVE